MNVKMQAIEDEKPHHWFEPVIVSAAPDGAGHFYAVDRTTNGDYCVRMTLAKFKDILYVTGIEVLPK